MNENDLVRFLNVFLHFTKCISRGHKNSIESLSKDQNIAKTVLNIQESDRLVDMLNNEIYAIQRKYILKIEEK